MIRILVKSKILFSLTFLVLLTLGTTAFAQTQEKTILETLSGSTKTCPYVGKGLYKPFSNINTDFVLFKDILNVTNGKEGDPSCLKIAGSTDKFVFMLFRIFIGVSAVLAVIYISIAGIGLILQEADPKKRIKSKQMLIHALVGLLLSVGAWVLLYTVNNKLVNFNFFTSAIDNTGFGGVISQGVKDAKASIEVINKNKSIAEQNKIMMTGSAGMPNINMYEGTVNPDGTITPPAVTVFGYNDGDGINGDTGDSGIGNGAFSPIPGYTTYTGNPDTIGVANSEQNLIRDFGSLSAAKNGAYAIFQNGKHVANVPIVDNSKLNFDLTYGLVKEKFDPNIQNSNSLNPKATAGITYKPIPNFYLTNERPINNYIEDKDITVVRGGVSQTVPIHKALPAEISQAINEGQVRVMTK